MFTVHEVDRDGDPLKALLSTEYIDVAEDAVRGLARHRFPEESRTVQDLIDPGTASYMICKDNVPYRRFVLEREFTSRWRFEEIK